MAALRRNHPRAGVNDCGRVQLGPPVHRTHPQGQDGHAGHRRGPVLGCDDQFRADLWRHQAAVRARQPVRSNLRGAGRVQPQHPGRRWHGRVEPARSAAKRAPVQARQRARGGCESGGRENADGRQARRRQQLFLPGHLRHEHRGRHEARGRGAVRTGPAAHPLQRRGRRRAAGEQPRIWS